MINISNMTPDEKLAVCDELKEKYHIEQYIDMAGMCNNLAIAVDFMLKHNYVPMDAVERNSLETLRELLPLCGHLFVQADDFYRK